MSEDIRTIIEAAILAPSGENVQPWRFKSKVDAIELHHVSVDSEIYDSGNRGSYISHGAALYNMSVCATNLGYNSTLILFPETQDISHIATINIEKSLNTISQNSSRSIPLRVTNRNAYKNISLDEDFSKEIDALVNDSKEVKYVRIKDKSAINILARIGSVNEEIMLQNKTLHDFFFDHVTWTKEEDREKKSGFYIKTLGLPIPIQFLFKIFKYWPVMNILKKVKFPSLVGKGNAKTYSSSSEIGILSISSDTKENFIYAGMLLERIWLSATNSNVSLQPLAGTIFMAYYLADNKNNANVFSSHEQLIIKHSLEGIEDYVTPGSHVAFMFRIGYGNQPEARSSRYDLAHFLI